MALIVDIPKLGVYDLDDDQYIDGAVNTSTDWRNLDEWIHQQECYFLVHKIQSDLDRVKHIVSNIDVRHWEKVNNYFKYNQKKGVVYEDFKRVLVKKVKRVIDPNMEKYDDKVDNLIDQFKINRINLENMLTWSKRLRSLCDGQAKEDYIAKKILLRVKENQRKQKCCILMKEVTDHINLYESRIKTNNMQVGKMKLKELNKLKALQDTLKEFMN